MISTRAKIPHGIEIMLGEKASTVARLIKGGKANGPIVDAFHRIQATGDNRDSARRILRPRSETGSARQAQAPAIRLWLRHRSVAWALRRQEIRAAWRATPADGAGPRNVYRPSSDHPAHRVQAMPLRFSISMRVP